MCIIEGLGGRRWEMGPGRDGGARVEFCGGGIMEWRSRVL